MGVLLWQFPVAFLGETQLWHSRATQPTAHTGCFSASIIHQIQTRTTGSLMHDPKTHKKLKRMLLNWTKQDKMCKFSRKLSFSKLLHTTFCPVSSSLKAFSLTSCVFLDLFSECWQVSCLRFFCSRMQLHKECVDTVSGTLILLLDIWDNLKRGAPMYSFYSDSQAWRWHWHHFGAMGQYSKIPS